MDTKKLAIGEMSLVRTDLDINELIQELGLYKSQGIIQQHGGSIQVRSGKDQALYFRYNTVYKFRQRLT